MQTGKRLYTSGGHTRLQPHASLCLLHLPIIAIDLAGDGSKPSEEPSHVRLTSVAFVPQEVHLAGNSVAGRATAGAAPSTALGALAVSSSRKGREGVDAGTQRVVDGVGRAVGVAVLVVWQGVGVVLPSQLLTLGHARVARVRSTSDDRRGLLGDTGEDRGGREDDREGGHGDHEEPRRGCHLCGIGGGGCVGARRGGTGSGVGTVSGLGLCDSQDVDLVVDADAVVDFGGVDIDGDGRRGGFILALVLGRGGARRVGGIADEPVAAQVVAGRRRERGQAQDEREESNLSASAGVYYLGKTVVSAHSPVIDDVVILRCRLFYGHGQEDGSRRLLDPVPAGKRTCQAC